MSGLIEAVKAHFAVSADAHLTCTRCLAEWDETDDRRGRSGVSADPG